MEERELTDDLIEKAKIDFLVREKFFMITDMRSNQWLQVFVSEVLTGIMMTNSA